MSKRIKYQNEKGPLGPNTESIGLTGLLCLISCVTNHLVLTLATLFYSHAMRVLVDSDKSVSTDRTSTSSHKKVGSHQDTTGTWVIHYST